MNENIKVRKFVFDDKNPRIKFNEEERLKLLRTSSILIQILEIETENPSDLIFVATEESIDGSRVETAEYLFSYRDKMLYQDGKYIMRLNYYIKTAGKYFELDILNHNGKPFKVTAYYSTN